MKNQPTKETLIKFARRHALDIDGYYQDEKERDPHKREIDAIVRQLKAVRKQRDSFRKQRNELINDMRNVKRKAEILDKLEEMFETSANANRKHGFNGAAEVYEQYLDIIRERDSDVEV